MLKGSDLMANENKRELTITRTFDAPIELVWKTWTTQELVKKWWGPRGVTNPVCEWDAKPNGKLNIVMQAGKEMGSFAGQKWPMDGIFKEVKPNTRLAFTSRAIDDKQEALIESDVTVDLEKQGSKTKMVLKIVVTKAVKGKTEGMLEGMSMGWNQQIDKLNEELGRMAK
jgi:uncharacterized protein YndB with AHSA1/START domain